MGGQESRWEIQAAADSPPSVTIERPGANTYVTPSASVELHSVAKDDLGVRNITLHFQPSMPLSAAPGEAAAAPADAAEQTISLFDGPVFGADGSNT